MIPLLDSYLLRLSMHTPSSVRSLLGAGLLLAPGLAQAAVFSFGEDWSLSANPQNGYSYGLAANTTAPLTLFTQGYSPQAGLEFWRTLDVELPVVVKNTTGSDISTGTAFIRAAASRFLNVHPSISGEYSVISYALPSTGTLAFTADFASHDVVGATTDVHVFLGGTELFSGNIAGSTLSYTTPGGGLAVTAGDTLVVRVGFGTGGHSFDSTGVKVEGSVTAVPEPTDYAAAAGLALVVFGAWRRCRR